MKEALHMTALRQSRVALGLLYIYLQSCDCNASLLGALWRNEHIMIWVLSIALPVHRRLQLLGRWGSSRWTT